MKCATDHCDEIIAERSQKLYCKNCRSGMYYWSKKKPAQVEYRSRQLIKLGARIRERKDRKAVR